MNPDYPAAVFAAVVALAAVAFLAVRDAKVKHGWPWHTPAGRHRTRRRPTLVMHRGRLVAWDLRGAR